MITLKQIYYTDILTEGSVTPKDIPEKFYVAIEFRNLEQLVDRKIIGVKGITSSLGAARQFAYHSPIIITMPGPETFIENKLSRVNYNNPDYLISKNLSAWKRVNDSDGEKFFLFVCRNYINEFASPELTQESIINLFNEVTLKAFNAHKKVKINSVNDFCNFLMPFLKEAVGVAKFDSLKEIVMNRLYIADTELIGEKEWIVKNETLIIPDESTLKIYLERAKVVAFPLDPIDLIEKAGLAKHYNITYY